MMRIPCGSRLIVWFGFAVGVCSTLVAEQPGGTQSPDSTYTFRSNVNVVLVPVLVRDRQGRDVGNLKKEDFQLWDNGKPQVISGFMIQKREGIDPAKRVPAAPLTPGVTPPPRPATIPNRFIVFLFDDMHLSIGDLAQAQKAGTRVLATSLADTDTAAVVSMSGKVNSGLTTDRSQLQAAIMKLQPENLYRMTGSECPNIDYYHADLIVNKHDSAALEAAIEEVMSCSPNITLRSVAEHLAEAAASQTLAAGEQDVQVAFATIREYVRRMAKLPGLATLILVSPGFLTLNNHDLSEESQIMDAAAESNVIISALDARGLYVSEIDASERGGSSALSTRVKSEYRRDSMSLNEGVMASLAAGTGGTYFHNSNDLNGGFERLAAAPEYLYMLEFSIADRTQDGRYHRLKVKVNHDGASVQSRRGYFAPKASKKDPQPRDQG